MNIQITAQSVTDVHVYLAESATRRNRLMGRIVRAPVAPVVPAKPVEAPPPPRIYLSHDAHVLTWKRWRASAGSPLKNYIIRRCEELGIPYEAMVSQRKTNDIAVPRQMLMWEIKTIVKPDVSYPAIGRLFGGRDHTTALHGVKAHQARIDRGEG